MAAEREEGQTYLVLANFEGAADGWVDLSDGGIDAGYPTEAADRAVREALASGERSARPGELVAIDVDDVIHMTTHVELDMRSGRSHRIACELARKQAEANG